MTGQMLQLTLCGGGFYIKFGVVKCYPQKDDFGTFYVHLYVSIMSGIHIVVQYLCVSCHMFISM